MKEASEKVKQEIANDMYNVYSENGENNFCRIIINEMEFVDEDKERFVVFDSEDEEYDYDEDEYEEIQEKVADDINDMIEQKFDDEGYDAYYSDAEDTLCADRPLSYIYENICKTLKNSIVGKEMEESIVAGKIEDALEEEFAFKIGDYQNGESSEVDDIIDEIEADVENSFERSKFDGNSYVIYPTDDGVYKFRVEFIIIDDSDEEDPIIKVTDVSYDA